LHQVFDMMPIAALVDDIAFCVHGGIGHHVTSVAQVEKIKRPCKVCLFAAARNVLTGCDSTQHTTFTPHNMRHAPVQSAPQRMLSDQPTIVLRQFHSR